MRFAVRAVCAICVAVALGEVAYGGQVESRARTVFVMECGSQDRAVQDEILSVDVGAVPNDHKPTAVVANRGSGPLNTFVASSKPDVVGCVQVAQGLVVARDVAMRIPRDTCERTDTWLATDLVIVELPTRMSVVTDSMIVLSQGRQLGSVVAVAGPKLLVNLIGSGTEKTYRAEAASALTARVRSGEIEVTGRAVEDESRTTATRAAVASAGETLDVEGGGGEMRILEPFVFVGSATCKK